MNKGLGMLPWVLSAFSGDLFFNRPRRKFVALPNVTSEDIKRAGEKLNKIKPKRTKRGFRG